MSGDTADLPSLTRPHEAIPAGACDCHGHIFGPLDRYPLGPGKMGPLAPVEAFVAAHEAAGLERAVSVQPSAYVFDNNALIDGIATSPRSLRGIAVPSPDVTEAELAQLAANGIAGLRFTSIGGPFGARLAGSSLDLDDLARIGPQLHAHGLHANIWADTDRLVAAAATLAALDCPVVIDHMAGAKADLGADHPDFCKIIDLAREHGWWIKLCPIRVSAQAPHYADARPFHDALLEAIPDRLLWCSDWPFLGLTGEARPTIGALLDLFREWTPDDALRQQILVDNPARLYRFEEN